MNHDDVRKLAASTAAKAASLAKSAAEAPPAKAARPAHAAKLAARPKAGPVPFKPRQRPALAVVGGNATKPKIKVTEGLLARASARRPTKIDAAVVATMLKAYQPPPGVLPAGKKAGLAMDALPSGIQSWGGDWFAQAGYYDALAFMGYPVLAEFAQRAEYRKACERLATECTRKWIKITSNGQEDKSERISKIETYLKDIKLREVAEQAVFMDAAMGRAHWYLDTGDTDDRAELAKPLGDGRNKFSLAKISPEKPLQRIQVVDPTWTYPAQYNANDPLKPDWLRPSSWYSMAKEVHTSRLLTFVGRPVPDLFKPAFNFGGLPLTQMMRTFVDNWTDVRNHIAKIVANFSKNGIKTDLMTDLAPAADGGTGDDGANLMRRLALYTTMSDNDALLVLNKDTEEFFQYNTPLGTLDQLMSQFLEQILLPSGMPLVVFLGLTPHGLNASSEGEMLAWESWVHAFQPHFFGDSIQRVIDFVQLSIDGKLDPEIGYEWVPLRTMTEKEQAELRKSDAERDGVFLDRGVVSPVEVRQKLAGDPASGYSNIDPEDVPEAPEGDDDGEGGGGEDGGEEDDAGAEPKEGGDSAVLPFAGDRGEWDEGKHPRDEKGRFSESAREYINPSSEAHAVRINEKLRSGGSLSEKQKRVAQDIDAAIEAAEPLAAEKTVYRGIGTRPDGIKRDRHVRDPGFMSTSADHASALAYAESGKNGVLYEIRLPTGTKALSTAQYDNLYNGGEQEYILPRGSRLLVRGVQKTPDGTTIVRADYQGAWLKDDEKEAVKTTTDLTNFKSKREVITHLLTKGTTAADVLKATGWPSVSMPAQAAASGMKLEKFKEDGVTKYRGVPMTEDELEEMRQARTERRNAKLRAQGKTPGLRGPKARDPQTFTLLEFLSDKGGLKPNPELANLFGGTNPFIPGFGRLFRKNGLSLDRAREAAVETGYLADAGRLGAGLSTSTVRQLLDAIDGEARGKKTYQIGHTSNSEGTEGEIDREQEAHAMESALDQALEESGLRPADVGRKARDRVIEIMRHEGESDPIAAWERAVMEEDQHGADEGRFSEREDVVPGWDVPDDPGPALAPSEGAQGGGRERTGAGAREPRKGNRKAQPESAPF